MKGRPTKVLMIKVGQNPHCGADANPPNKSGSTPNIRYLIKSYP